MAKRHGEESRPSCPSVLHRDGSVSTDPPPSGVRVTSIRRVPWPACPALQSKSGSKSRKQLMRDNRNNLDPRFKDICFGSKKTRNDQYSTAELMGGYGGDPDLYPRRTAADNRRERRRNAGGFENRPTKASG